MSTDSPFSKKGRSQPSPMVATQMSPNIAKDVFNQMMVESAFDTKQKAVVTVNSNSPFGNKPTQLSNNVLAFSDKDIEGLGSQVHEGTMAVVQKMTQKMSVAKFGDLGDMLANLQLEADTLDPDAQNKGISGWIRSKFFDVRKLALKQLQTAEKTFDDLAQKMASHITVHETWVNDLETLYIENFEQYKRVITIIQQGEQWENAALQSIKNLPEIDPTDPEAAMKMQIRRDAEAMLNRLRQRIDSFRRLKVLTECNSPKIRSQQESSRNAARTLRNYISEVLPLIKFEFALYMQSLDVKKTNRLSKGSRDLAEQSLQKSASSAKESIIEAARESNTSIVSSNTLSYIRNCMLEAVTQVGQIEHDAQVRRLAEAKQMQDEQTQYLKQLQENGARL